MKRAEAPMRRSDGASADWRALLGDIYPRGDAVAQVEAEIAGLIGRHRTRTDGDSVGRWDQRDVWLIAYPDQFRVAGQAPLAALHRVLTTHFADVGNGVHILPFFPSSSDEGFAVMDYQTVDPAFGSWQDIEAIAARWRLMVDAVINHASVQGDWFTAWAGGDAAYRDFFRTADPDADLSAVVRARQHPLLTRFTTVDGERWVWTTFSADQADLDYRNPAVLVRILDVVLTYASHGAGIIRVDAAGFLWKEEASSSIHLPQTHAIVRFLSACLAEAYPDVLLVTETNGPHDENISYLGDGRVREADAVYQFALPPLVLHAYATGDASVLKEWLGSQGPPAPGTTFLNFLASHDGVGLRPLEGLVAAADVDLLVEQAESSGSLVSRRSGSGGEATPYELNGTWFDLIRGEGGSEEDAEARHLGSHAIMLALRGIPLLYIHSLLAGSNDLAAVRSSGSARAISRTRFAAPDNDIDVVLGRGDTRATRMLAELGSLVAWRTTAVAFHPDSQQIIHETPAPVIGIERRHSSGAAASVFVNVSGENQTLAPAVTANPAAVSGHRVDADGEQLTLGPWGYACITR